MATQCFLNYIKAPYPLSCNQQVCIRNLTDIDIPLKEDLKEVYQMATNIYEMMSKSGVSNNSILIWSMTHSLKRKFEDNHIHGFKWGKRLVKGHNQTPLLQLKYAGHTSKQCR